MTPIIQLIIKEEMEYTYTPFEVEVVDILGSDLTVVNSARISFGSKSQELTDKDAKLIQFLAKEKHYSPFRHCMLQFRIKAPEFVMRQMYKHVVGCSYTSVHPTKDHAWNEISGRYKAYDEIYIPSVWYKQHPLAKQCSGEPLDEKEQAIATKHFEEAIDTIMRSYRMLLRQGVSKEQARMLLPLTFMTEVIWTASLQAIQNFVELRDSLHAQEEIRLLAQEIKKLTTEKFPISFQALMTKDE